MTQASLSGPPPSSTPPQTGVREPEETPPRKLLRRFGLLSLASVTVILLLTGIGLHFIYRTQLVRSAEASSVAVAQAILSQERQALLQTSPEGRSRIVVQPEDFEGLDERMRGFLGPFGIVKIKVYDGGKKVVYSTDKTIIGQVDEANPRLESVLSSGVPDSRMERRDKIVDLHGESFLTGDVVEAYVPIRVGEQVIGSIEIYLDITPSYDNLVATVSLSVAALLAVLAAVFGSLYFLMWQGAMRLERATIDPLTGLTNRRQLFTRIGEEYARMGQESRERLEDDMGFVMADIDHFKWINDAHGHPTGDEVLRETAARLKQGLRTFDVVGRYGGDEFLIVLPHTGLAESESIAERMRKNVVDRPFEVDGQTIAVTASFGVAHSSTDRVGIADVIRRADAALYRAKESGRNKVMSAA